jgi:hypothetical protein
MSRLAVLWNPMNPVSRAARPATAAAAKSK